MEMSRHPAVAGTFYDRDRNRLLQELEAAFLGSLGPGKLPEANPTRLGRVVGLVSPHAGYVYSGYAAAAAFNALAEDGIPDVAVIIGPNHRGLGIPAAIMEQGIWETPLGEIRIDGDVSACLLESCPYLQADASAHRLEHSVEVQVPFLQFISGSRTKIVPITIAVAPTPEARVLVDSLGSAIANALQGKSAVVIASTDMTHYESIAAARLKDEAAIEAILALDAGRLLDVVSERGISMCGVVPTAVALAACKELGAAKAELLRYYTSGDITGEADQVVGYAALKIVSDQV
jgi:AmmeMemoRadiSam system protein B